MKYAKIVDNKVVDVVTGLKPKGYVVVIKKWSIPRDYPSDFYVPTSNVSRLNVVDGEVHETWGFALKDVDSIKQDIYKKQKLERQQKQLGSFMVGEMEVSLKDREDSLIIASLTAKNRKFKVGQGKWATLTGVEVQALKDAHEAHVQTAYDWEMQSNTDVDAILDHDGLAAYVG